MLNRSSGAWAWLFLGATLAGCQVVPRAAEGEREILLDGDIAEWDEGEAAWGNEHYVYLRFTVEGEPYSLQAGPRTLAFFLDADGDAGTGRIETEGPLAGLGIDLEGQFSPRRERGPGRGLAMWRIHPDGRRESVKPGAFDVAVAPTYAASWYELRISRTPEGVDMPPKGLCGLGTLRGMIATLGADGAIEAWSDPFEVAPGPTCAGGRELSTVFAPAKPEGGVRVLSWNVERSSPTTNPEPFGRVLRALAPDVLLFQEWEHGDGASVAAWLTGIGLEGWTVRKADGDLSSGGGVLVASRFPIDPLGGALTVEGGRVRCVAGVVQSPIGSIAAASVHLKCCGSKDSSEDRKRLGEARAINALLSATAPATGAAIRVVAGDLNLVGSRPPIDVLRAGLDADGSDLAIADAKVLGDGTYVTWRDDGTEFPPGRLDYLVYSDATVEAANAFVFDTARLTSIIHDAMGVRADDTSASDHRPVVVDLVRIDR